MVTVITDQGEREATTIYAEQYRGHNTATVTYFVRTPDGAALRFRKKFNPHIRYPKIAPSDWGEWFQDKQHRWGTYGMWWSETRRTCEYPVS